MEDSPGSLFLFFWGGGWQGLWVLGWGLFCFVLGLGFVLAWGLGFVLVLGAGFGTMVGGWGGGGGGHSRCCL